MCLLYLHRIYQKVLILRPGDKLLLWFRIFCTWFFITFPILMQNVEEQRKNCRIPDCVGALCVYVCVCKLETKLKVHGAHSSWGTFFPPEIYVKKNKILKITIACWALCVLCGGGKVSNWWSSVEWCVRSTVENKRETISWTATANLAAITSMAKWIIIIWRW